MAWWVRGRVIGHGSFSTVSLATPRCQNLQYPSLMAVKSCGASHSASLANEAAILGEMRSCPDIVSCFGGSFTVENGERLYNVLLEYAYGGSLADKVLRSGDVKIPESDVRRYTKSILRGLLHVHNKGYVHCDIKIQNVLLFPSADGRIHDAKIADFGLAKRAGVKDGEKWDIRGTPLYMSPETVLTGQQESPADIWALGCLLSEMVTGVPAWSCQENSDAAGLLMRIGTSDEVPEIPATLSDDGKDFLARCFLKEPKQRWTAQMLLDHPFVSDRRHDPVPSKPPPSPRGPFDFPDIEERPAVGAAIPHPQSPGFPPGFCEWREPRRDMFSVPLSNSSPAAANLRRLTKGQSPDWPVSSSWIAVRSYDT